MLIDTSTMVYHAQGIDKGVFALFCASLALILVARAMIEIDLKRKTQKR